MKYGRVRRDANHKEIVAALRRIGCTVVDLSAVGNACPDLLVGFRARNHLLEVKNPARKTKGDNAARTLSKQEEWRDDWCGSVTVVWSIEDALIAVQ